MDEVKSFWEAIKPLISNPVAYVIIGVLIILAVYMLFVKKDKRFKAVVTKILQGIIKDAYDKGIEVEFVVDDIIAKAIKKIKEKPDPWDGLLIWVLQAKWFRNKVISVVKDKIEEIAQAETDSVLEEVSESNSDKK